MDDQGSVDLGPPEEIADALKREGERPIPALVEAHHLALLRTEASRLRLRSARRRRTRTAAVGLASAAAAFVVGAMILQPTTVRIEAADPTTTVELEQADGLERDPTTTAEPDPVVASTSSTPPTSPPPAAEDRATTVPGTASDPGDDRVEPTAAGGPTSASTTSDSSGRPSSTSVGDTTTVLPSTTSTATTASTRPSSTAISSTIPPTTVPTTETIPPAVGASYQERLDEVIEGMNACLGGDLEVFVGFPDRSDHPRANDPGYIAAIERCGQFYDVRSVEDGHLAWRQRLSDGQKATLNTLLPPVHGCLADRGWDVGSLVMQDGVLIWSRYPAVSWGDRATGRYQSDFQSCGWFDLPLG